MKIDKSGQVYLFHNINTGLYKIGYSGDLQKRLSAIVCQSGCDIELVYNTDRILNPNKYENKAHAVLDNFRVIGEWFKVDRDLAIEVIKNACIDADKSGLLKDYSNGMAISELMNKYNLSRSGIVKHIQEAGEWLGDGRKAKLEQRHAAIKPVKICKIYHPYHFKRVSENIYTNGKDYLFMVYKNGSFIEYLFDSLDESKEFRTQYKANIAS